MKTTPGSSWNVFPFEEETSHTFFDTHSQSSIFICVIIFLSDVTVQESKLSIFRAVSLSLSWKMERLVLRKMVFQEAAKSRITEYPDLLRQCYFKFNDSQHSVCSPLDLYFNIKRVHMVDFIYSVHFHVSFMNFFNRNSDWYSIKLFNYAVVFILNYPV